jgi:hypothetical protein
MKKIITSLLLITSLQILAVSADMIINRTGQPITVTYANASGPLFSTGAITLASDAAHRADLSLTLQLQLLAQCIKTVLQALPLWLEL